jgi:hypothetical protein
LDFRKRFGEHWEPAPLLAELAAKNGTFAKHAQLVKA